MHTQQPSALQKGAYTLVLIGALNWGLVGLFKFNLVHLLLGRVTVLEHVVYILVGLSALVLLGGCTPSSKKASHGCGRACEGNCQCGPKEEMKEHECEHC